LEQRQVPSDSNGVYSLPDGYEAVTGETIQANQHNPPLEDLASSMSARLMRSGVAPMTGPLKIADGSVGSPGLKFNTDGTTGFYKTTNGIGVSVGGTKVAEFTSSGLSRMIGELIPWTLLSAPSGWVLPYGQTLSRTTYADLWTIAQTEISNGNTFYNNGDGSTTFGIGDMRGRVPAGKDNMGGTSAGRLTPPASGGVSDSTVLGSAGGESAHTSTATEMPSHTHSGTTGTEGSYHTHSYSHVTQLIGLSSGVGSSTNGVLSVGNSDTSTESSLHTHTFTTGSTGSGGAHNNVQPTMICNYMLYAGA
jgi:microcystin-dependent protein